MIVDSRTKMEIVNFKFLVANVPTRQSTTWTNNLTQTSLNKLQAELSVLQDRISFFSCEFVTTQLESCA